MCLSIAINRPKGVLETGHHLGFEYAITHNDMGFRCGYIRVPKGHPWHGKDYDDIEVNVHGGLTFVHEDTPCDKGGADDGWWIGFDCAHCDDLPDPSLSNLTDLGFQWPIEEGVVRDQDYVRDECFSLCQQAKDAEAPPIAKL